MGFFDAIATLGGGWTGSIFGPKVGNAAGWLGGGWMGDVLDPKTVTVSPPLADGKSSRGMTQEQIDEYNRKYYAEKDRIAAGNEAIQKQVQGMIDRPSDRQTILTTPQKRQRFLGA